MPVIPTLRRQRQADLCEFEASMVYRVSSRIGPKATEKPGLEKKMLLLTGHGSTYL